MGFNKNRIFRILFLSIFLFPGLAFSQSWDISISPKYLGTSTQNNSRIASAFSNTTLDVRHSNWSFSLNYDAFDFYDEAVVVANQYVPAIVNKVAGNRYHLKYVGFSGGLSFPFWKFLRYDAGFSINALTHSTVEFLPEMNLQTGEIENHFYDVNKTRVYISNYNHSNWNLNPIVLGVYQRIYARFRVYKNVGLTSTIEYQNRFTPMIYNESINPGFFDGNYVGISSMVLFSFGVSYAF